MGGTVMGMGCARKWSDVEQNEGGSAGSSRAQG